MKNSEKSFKNKAVSGLAWKFFEKAGMQVMQFVIQIVLARLLMPEDYGLVGLLTIFITISDVFILQGFATALIQKKDADELDYSSVFFANLLMALVIYLVLYLVSPYVAIFYNEKKLTSIMRVLSLNVIFGSFCAVHNAIISRKLEFKKSFYRVLTNTLTQGIVGISLAYLGYGVWSLVFSKISGTLVGAIVLCLTVKWAPKKLFSVSRLKKLFSYSSKVLCTNLLNTVFNNIHSLFIGKFFAKADLGYYQRGQQFPQVLMTAVDGSLNEVLYPTLSAIQDDLERLKSALRRSMKTSMFIMLPVLMGLFATAEAVVTILLTEKWLPCVPFLRLSCIICAFWPLSARGHALNAIGKSNITFKLSLVSKGLTVFFIVLCIPFGIYAIMLGSIFTSCISMWITSYYVSKYIKYNVKELIMDLLPSILISLIMLVFVQLIGYIDINIYIKLVFQVSSGVIIYVGLSKMFKVESFEYVMNFVKQMLGRKK